MFAARAVVWTPPTKLGLLISLPAAVWLLSYPTKTSSAFQMVSPCSTEMFVLDTKHSDRLQTGCDSLTELSWPA